MEKAILHQPKIMFVNTVLQNPLGTSLSQAQAHRLLALAEQFDFWLVEDDIYRELCTRPEPSLAAMDGLRRVIRVAFPKYSPRPCASVHSAHRTH
jgi:DNA-binding transcriptional MocR family regulator